MNLFIDSKLLLMLLMVFLFSACDANFAQNGEGELPADNYEELEKGFQDPPDLAKPKVYWWWLNGSADSLRITEELEAFKKAGISGVDIFDIGTPDHSDTRSIVEPGPAFMSDAYLGNISHAVEVAGELGLQVGLNLSSSWNA